MAEADALDPAGDRIAVGFHIDIVSQGKREGKAEGRVREERVGKNINELREERGKRKGRMGKRE